MTITVIPVIVSGGSGSRLWPLSRETHPKTFIKLADGQSLLQKTFVRACSILHNQSNEVCIVTRDELYFQTKNELEELAVKQRVKITYILEPTKRNTAAAITLAGLKLAKSYPQEAIIAVLPADHLITDIEAYKRYANEALHLAENGYVVTLALTPTHADSAYGYLEIDKQQSHLTNNSYRVKRFIEKPQLAIAEEYVKSGKHFWNAGIFFFTLKTLLNEMERYSFPIFKTASECLSVSYAHERHNVLKLDAQTFAKIPSTSIDYALMEKTNNLAAVICDYAWDDIGSWNSLSDLSNADDHGNKIVGESINYDTKNCYLHSTTRMIGTVGIDNLVIVDTADALLVVKKDRVQDVKELVQLLKTTNSELIKNHKQVHRPWGHFNVVAEGKEYKIKFINVHPGASLSLQRHHHRSEHWIVLSGTALVTIDEKKFLMNSNESTFIPLGSKHRLENPGINELIIVEVQCGDYLGEDDIIRYEDQYERVTE